MKVASENIDASFGQHNSEKITTLFWKDLDKREVSNNCVAAESLIRDFGIRRLTDGEIEKFQKYRYILPPYVTAHYVEVCKLTKSACFFESKTMRNRIILSTDNVKILVIPQYWLRTVDKVDIWRRVQIYMTTRIPNTQQVFKLLVKHWKWRNHTEKIKKCILSKGYHPSDTAWFDIPISIRIHETY